MWLTIVAPPGGIVFGTLLAPLRMSGKETPWTPRLIVKGVSAPREPDLEPVNDAELNPSRICSRIGQRRP